MPLNFPRSGAYDDGDDDDDDGDDDDDNGDGDDDGDDCEDDGDDDDDDDDDGDDVFLHGPHAPALPMSPCPSLWSI